MTTHAFCSDDVGLPGLAVEVDGLMATVATGDVATSATNTSFTVNGGEDFSVAVEVGR